MHISWALTAPRYSSGKTTKIQRSPSWSAKVKLNRQWTCYRKCSSKPMQKPKPITKQETTLQSRISWLAAILKLFRSWPSSTISLGLRQRLLAIWCFFISVWAVMTRLLQCKTNRWSATSLRLSMNRPGRFSPWSSLLKHPHKRSLSISRALIASHRIYWRNLSQEICHAERVPSPKRTHYATKTGLVRTV